MGLMSRGKKDKNKPAEGEEEEVASKPAAAAKAVETMQQEAAAAGAASPAAAMPGEMTNVFEFGSARSGVTLAGYSPVLDEVGACRWEVLPTGGARAPKFRIIF